MNRIGLFHVLRGQLACRKRSHSKNFAQTRPSEAAKHSFEAEIAKSSDFKGEFHGQINWLCNSGDHQEFRGNLWNSE